MLTIAEAPPVPMEGLGNRAQDERPGSANWGPRDLRTLPDATNLGRARAQLVELEAQLLVPAPVPEAATIMWRAALVAQALAAHPELDGDQSDYYASMAQEWLGEISLKPNLSAYLPADEALYMLGVLTINEDPSVGQTAFRELIMRYPTSEWVGPAYIAFGDHYLALDKPELALRFYEKTVDLSKPDRAYAFVMQARCLMMNSPTSQARPDKALAMLLRAWRESGDSQFVRDELDAARVQQLVEVAIVPVYLAVGKPAKAPNFFAKFLREPATSRVLTALARAYSASGDLASANLVCPQGASPGECVAR